MNRSVLLAGAVVFALAVGVVGGYWLSRSGEPTTVASPGVPARQPLFYRSPMNPQVTSPVPAKDAMGMDYVPVYADSESSDAPAGTVRIDPVTRQSIGVRTAKAERRSISRVISTVGRIDYDEQRLYRLHPKVEGWVEELRVDTTGEEVTRGDVLLGIYSPQLVSTQQEYLLALRNLEKLSDSPFPDIRRGAQELLDSSFQRLKLLDVPEHQLQELKDTRQVMKRLHIHSPATGVVTHVGVREGQYVAPKDELFVIADLSTIWVFVDIYEDELPWVQIGDSADMRVLAVPGEVFNGRLTYIYPYAESKTRTVKARLEFDNPNGLLKPNMFANVSINARTRQDAVTVPAQAIVRSGLREQLFVVRGPGVFEPRDVIIGVTSDGLTEVSQGIQAGEEVVVSAQFLIDSESKLREATAKMQKVGTKDQEAGHDHPAD